MILEILVEIKTFSILLAFAMTAYCQIMVSFTAFEGSDSQWKSSYVIAFGDLGGDYTDFGVFKFFMFMIFTFFIPLLLMNMLIAIMSDTYSRVQANAIASDARALADMILEMEQLYRFFGVRSDPSR